MISPFYTVQHILRVDVGQYEAIKVPYEEKDGGFWQPDYECFIPSHPDWQERMQPRIYFTYRICHAAYNEHLDYRNALQVILRLEKHPPSRLYHRIWLERLECIYETCDKYAIRQVVFSTLRKQYHDKPSTDASFWFRYKVLIPIVHGNSQIGRLPVELFYILLSLLF